MLADLPVRLDFRVRLRGSPSGAGSWADMPLATLPEDLCRFLRTRCSWVVNSQLLSPKFRSVGEGVGEAKDGK
jgi:hypothetical protein